MRAPRLLSGAVLLLMCWLAGTGWSIVKFGERSSEARADVAIVLGAAVRGDRPSPVFAQRLAHAATLLRAGQVDRVLLTGGTGEGQRFAESAVGRAELLRQGVPEDRLLAEARSHTTRQNLVEARKVMRGSGLRTALVVSDPLHMKRAMAMADDLGIAAAPSPTPTTRYRSWSAKAPFLLRETYFLHHYWLFRQ